MSLGQFSATVLGIGLLAFDPAGAALALAAVTAGARRRGVTAVCVGYLVVMTALGVVGTFAVREFAHTSWARSLLSWVDRYHLVGWAEVAVAVACLVGAAWVARRALRRRGEAADADDAPGRGPALLRRWSLTSSATLAAGGALVAVSLLGDPAYALLAVAARDVSPWWWLPAWLVWAALSQVALMVLWGAALADRDGRLLERVGATVRSLLARSAWLGVVLLVAVGAFLAWDALERLG